MAFGTRGLFRSKLPFARVKSIELVMNLRRTNDLIYPIMFVYSRNIDSQCALCDLCDLGLMRQRYVLMISVLWVVVVVCRFEGCISIQ